MTRIPDFLPILLLVGALGGCSGGGGGGDAGPDAVTVSGTVTAAANLAVDTDTNDPQSPFASNDTFATAQPIGNPMLVGGYVTAVPTNRQGDRFANAADLDDVYAVDLTAGQSVVLEVSDPLVADIDLGLYNAAGELVDASLGIARFESVSATLAGRYFLRVNGFFGGSNYILSVGTGPVPAARGLRLAADFVPGEAIVQLRSDAAAPPGSGAAKALSALASQGVTIKAGVPDRPVLMALATVQAAVAPVQAPPLRGSHVSAGQAAKLDTLYRIKGLRQRAEVLSADPNHRIQAWLTPNDPYYPLQWHYPLINLPQAWDVTTGIPASGDVVVAVLDTGVLLAHQDLNGKLLRDSLGNVVGYDFIRSTVTANDGDGIDPDANDPGDQSTAGSSSWHGTHVAGTVAAASNNGVGVTGVSWGARIMPVRVLGKGGGTDYDLMQGVRYAAGLSNDSGSLPGRRADIINLSLGCLNCFSSANQALYDQVRAAGVIVVAAAGNESTASPSYPAAYAGVVSVSAVGIDRARAPYSNFGPSVDVAAPGGNTAFDLNSDGYVDGILSTLAGSALSSEYKFYQGTSMAAPHVSGVVALMKAVHPGLGPVELDGLLASGGMTTDLGAAGRDDQFGWGLVDAAKAVLEARRLASGGAALAVLAAQPTRFDFGSSATTQTLQLAKLGGGALSVTGVSDDAPWLAIVGSNLGPDQLGVYTLSVSRDGLAPGSYSATVTVSASNGSQLKLPVSMLVASQQFLRNTGNYWLLLMDQEFKLVRQIVSAGDKGSYPFQFADLPKGTYFLFAGTDSDWDDLICDDGEACGAYPTANEPVLIQADRDRTGLLFSVNLLPSPSALAGAGAQLGPLGHTGRDAGKGVPRAR